MIYSAVRVDEYIIFVDVRDETKYTDKLVAGVCVNIINRAVIFGQKNLIKNSIYKGISNN